jgi:hypothetical protein
METVVLRKNKVKPSQKVVYERFFVDIPKSDKTFFKHLVAKMGWDINDNASKEEESEPLLERLKAAILEAKAMEADIRKNGIKGYKTLDELLSEC